MGKVDPSRLTGEGSAYHRKRLREASGAPAAAAAVTVEATNGEAGEGLQGNSTLPGEVAVELPDPNPPWRLGELWEARSISNLVAHSVSADLERATKLACSRWPPLKGAPMARRRTPEVLETAVDLPVPGTSGPRSTAQAQAGKTSRHRTTLVGSESTGTWKCLDRKSLGGICGSTNRSGTHVCRRCGTSRWDGDWGQVKARVWAILQTSPWEETPANEVMRRLRSESGSSACFPRGLEALVASATADFVDMAARTRETQGCGPSQHVDHRVGSTGLEPFGPDAGLLAAAGRVAEELFATSSGIKSLLIPENAEAPMSSSECRCAPHAEALGRNLVQRLMLQQAWQQTHEPEDADGVRHKERQQAIEKLHLADSLHPETVFQGPSYPSTVFDGNAAMACRPLFGPLQARTQASLGLAVDKEASESQQPATSIGTRGPWTRSRGSHIPTAGNCGMGRDGTSCEWDTVPNVDVMMVLRAASKAGVRCEILEQAAERLKQLGPPWDRSD